MDLEIPSDDDMRALRQEFRGRARFLVDENAGDEVAELLRGQGYNTRRLSNSDYVGVAMRKSSQQHGGKRGSLSRMMMISSTIVHILRTAIRALLSSTRERMGGTMTASCGVCC